MIASIGRPGVMTHIERIKPHSEDRLPYRRARGDRREEKHALRDLCELCGEIKSSSESGILFDDA
jgi:hypothetical protein